MNWFWLSVAYLCGMLLVCALDVGVQRALMITAWFSPALILVAYFRSRGDASASRIERGLATAWLWLRRTVCLAAALLFGVLPLGIVLSGAMKEASIGLRLLVGASSAIVATVCVWWALFGTGLTRSFSDDRAWHEKRKQRYGWKR